MLLYSLKLAKANLKNRPGLTLLTIGAIAIGLALLTTTLTMSYQASKLPLPHKADALHTVLIDSREDKEPAPSDFEEIPRLTFHEVNNLMNDKSQDYEKTFLWKTYAFVNDINGKAHPRQVRAMAGNANFFTLFDTPFLYGSSWRAEDDTRGANVIVLSYQMNQHFFGGENSIGRTIRINSTSLKVVGVMAKWKIPSRFYDRTFSTNRFDDIFIPATLAMNLALPRRLDCWEKDKSQRSAFSAEDIDGLKASECTWLFFWVKLPQASDVDQYRAFLQNYVEQQKSFGRLPKKEKPALVSLKQYNELVVANDNGQLVFSILALLFYLVCLVNTVGILLARYMGKIPEIALRRALGAKKHVVLAQYLIEIGIIAMVGGFIGVGLSYFGLQGMKNIAIYQSDYTITAEAIQHLYQLDWVMILSALAIAVVSSLIVSLFPVWKMVNTAPAGQLKSQ